jgi:inosine triphosphate pyrophosphatase
MEPKISHCCQTQDDAAEIAAVACLVRPGARMKLARTLLSASSTTIQFVTGNLNKVQEIQRLLEGADDIPFQFIHCPLEVLEFQGDDPVDIARQKCIMAMHMVDGPVLIEDTSLCFDALHGLPGPYIKWFLQKLGHDGLNRLLVGFDNNALAYAQTLLALGGLDDKEIFVFEGSTQGRIVPARGSHNFGWDPIFEVAEGGELEGKTYAEMSAEEKNTQSHRAKALKKLQKFLIARACESE